MKKADLRILENAERETVEKMAERYSAIDDDEKKRIYRQISERCGTGGDFDEKTQVNGTEPYRRPKWETAVSIVSAAAVLVLAAAGTIHIFRGHGHILSPVSNTSEEESTVPTEPVIKNTYEGNFRTYYEMSDGSWSCEGHSYKYRLVIQGHLPNAAGDSEYVFLSNIPEISFERAAMASGLSSNSADYFSPDEAVMVELN